MELLQTFANHAAIAITNAANNVLCLHMVLSLCHTSSWFECVCVLRRITSRRVPDFAQFPPHLSVTARGAAARMFPDGQADSRRV